MKGSGNKLQLKVGCGFLIKTLMPFYLLPSPLFLLAPTEGISQSEARCCTKSSALIFSLIKWDFSFSPSGGCRHRALRWRFKGRRGPASSQASTCREERKTRGQPCSWEDESPRVAMCLWSAKRRFLPHRDALQHPPLTPGKIWWYKGLSSEKEGEDQAHVKR